MKRVALLFGTEMWEKFCFYGMRSIFALFMVHFLGISEAQAAIYYGAFLAFSYLTPIFGGFIADKILGYHKSVILGCALLCASQLLFFISACGVKSAFLSLLAAVFVMLGNGFFKPSITALLGIKSQNLNVDAVFSSYYFFLNLGVLLGSFIVPFFGDVVSGGVRDISAFKWGFLSAFLAQLLGLIIFILFSKDEGYKKDEIYINFNAKNFIICTAIFAVIFAVLSAFSGDNFIKSYVYPAIYSLGISLAVYILLDKSLSKSEKQGVWLIFTSAIFIVFFWATFEQAGSSLVFIANNQMDRNLFGFNIPPAMIAMFNPLFVLLLSFVFCVIYIKTPNFSGLDKQAFGLVLLGFSYLVIALNVKNLGQNLLDIKWFILLYFLQTCAEMLISPIGFALVAKFSPKQILGLMFGLFYLANAAGYALSGTLAALMPPTADKFSKAHALGIDLNAVLSDKVDANELEILKANALPSAYPEIFNIQITSLYEFFMLFFVLCAFGGALLFFVNKICYNQPKING